MSAGPRTKRPFAGAASDPAQRQITAFFNKTSSSTSSSSATTPTTTPLTSPPLPAHVQSNLLTVGMRIRKAIPEGHKTGSAYSAFSLWSDMDTKPGTNSPDLRPVPAVPGGGGGAGPRELTPFCGIHKVGGLSVQPTIDSFSYTPSGTDSVPSSQESTTSISSAMAMQATSSAAINRKRFYVTEEEEEQLQQQQGAGGTSAQNSSSSNIVAWRNHAAWLDGEISPRSLAPAEWGENSRIIAVPRRRMAGNGKSAGGSGGDTDGLLPPGAPAPADGDNQENMAVDDFDEAPFLDYRIGGSGGDMDVEGGFDG